MSITAYNVANYVSIVSDFAVVAGNAKAKANAFLPMAFAALVTNAKDTDTILKDLLGRDGDEKRAKAGTLFRSAKGKAVTDALPDAMGRSFRDLKAIWGACQLETQVGTDCTDAVKAFIGFVSEEQLAEVESLWLAESERLAASGKQAGAKTKALFIDTFMADLYPNRPANLSQLKAAIEAIKNKAALADLAQVADSEGEAEGEGEAETPSDNLTVNGVTYPNATCAARAQLLADALEYIQGMTAIEADMHNDTLTALLPAIGGAFETLAAWQAANVAIAA